MSDSDIIILTKSSHEGKKLRNSLSELSQRFLNVPCYTKEDIISDKKLCKSCRFIFSTWYMPTFTQEEIKAFFPNLHAVFYAAGTVKYFAEPFLNSGVRVYSAACANGVPVAEFTTAQILLANKGYFQAQQKYNRFLWRYGFKRARKVAESKSGNYMAYIGIIGCGAIGSKVIELLQPYDLNILVYDPYVSEEKITELGAKKVDLETLMSTCDVISNHLPDIPATQGFYNYDLLSRMKDTATFINTGRGRQVVEKDLAKILRTKNGICALLDVTTHEPILPWSPLFYCKNVFLTPHIAGSLSGEFNRMVQYMLDAFYDLLSRKTNTCEVSINSMDKKA